MTNEIQRNDPCPCGSGKKYKKCCMLKEQASRPLTREVLGRACQEAYSLLLEFVVSLPEPTADPSFDITIPELPDEETEQMLMNELVNIWFFYLWFPSDGVEQAMPSDETFAARFLAEKEESLDGIVRRFIEAARSEPFSYWQVESVSPGTGVLLKDLVTGEERSVADLTASRLAAKWDIYFAQVVGLDGVYILNGVGVYPLTPNRFRPEIEEFANEIREMTGGASDRLSLLKHQLEFLEHYLLCIDEILSPTMPVLTNTDGEKLVQAKSRFGFVPARRAEVVEALRAMRSLNQESEEDGHTVFVWLAKSKAAGHQGKVLKGRIVVGPDWLESECNSEPRDQALRRRLLKSLGDLLTHESTNLKPYHPDPFAERSAESDEKQSGAIDLSTLSDEDRQVFEETIEKQYMSWLDQAVPMLGGKTPRETARTAQGKADVAAMINDWENIQNRNPNFSYRFDFNKLRAPLQIDPE